MLQDQAHAAGSPLDAAGSTQMLQDRFGKLHVDKGIPNELQCAGSIHVGMRTSKMLLVPSTLASNTSKMLLVVNSSNCPVAAGSACC